MPQIYRLELEGVEGTIRLTHSDGEISPTEYKGTFEFKGKNYVVEVKNERDRWIGEISLEDSILISSGFHQYAVIDHYIEMAWKECIARARISNHDRNVAETEQKPFDL